MSLISLLVGLLISMIALMGMLSLYGTLAESSAESARDARIGGERSTALFVATARLQNAGYGIEAAKRGADLLLLNGVSLNKEDGSLSGGTPVTGNNTGNTLLWRFQPSGAAMQCSGLHAPSNNDQGGLYLLLPRTCSALYVTDNWSFQPLLIDNTDAVDNRQLVKLSITEHSPPGCGVLGITGTGKFSVNLGTTDRNGNIVASTTCLVNFLAE